MRGLGSGHVTCGPMRGLEINFTGRGKTDMHAHRQTDRRTSRLSDWIVLGADSVKINCVTIMNRVKYLSTNANSICMFEFVKAAQGGHILQNMLILSVRASFHCVPGIWVWIEWACLKLSPESIVWLELVCRCTPELIAYLFTKFFFYRSALATAGLSKSLADFNINTMEQQYGNGVYHSCTLNPTHHPKLNRKYINYI